MKRFVYIFIIAFCLHWISSVYAKPSFEDKEQSTLVLTFWDVRSDLSYILDLEIKVYQMISEPHAFELNVKEIINEKTNVSIADFTNFRWSVFGAINLNKQGWGGYVAAYDHSSEPHSNVVYPWIPQRIDRMRKYIATNNGAYSDEPYEVSVRQSDNTDGHYLTGWQGNIRGLTNSDLEGKVQGDSDVMTMWSLHMTDFAFDEKTFSNNPEFIVQNHGEISLSSSGILSFVPTHSQAN